MEEQIYRTPDDYDLEHAKPEPDVGLYVDLAREWKPPRVLELACGSGRISFPLARALAEFGGELTGLDRSREMLEASVEKAKKSPCPAAAGIRWVEADMRTWRSPEPFDLVLCPCASASHLLGLEEQISAWRAVHRNLAPAGRFLVAEQMANLPVLSDSLSSPPRVLLELDSDTARESGGRRVRLVRYRATRYFPHQQRASVRFLYDKLHEPSEISERFLSDYECHVFFPRELELLFRFTGFEIEHIWGDYRRNPLSQGSRHLIIVGRKSSSTMSAG